MCSCTETRCRRCRELEDSERTILGLDPSPETHQEMLERLTVEFAVRVVDPAVKGTKPW